MKKLKKVIIYIVSVFCGYLAIGYFLHLVVFPENKPDISNYFEEGQQYYSKAEGFDQTVVAQKDGLVHCNLVVDPHASGPPKHIHTEFDEYFEIKNGELTVWVDGAIKKIRPGQIVHIPKGTPHKAYNETSETIHLKEGFPMPEKFAFYLSQIYGIMDHFQNFGQMPATLFMIAPLQQAGFDSFLAEGPPIFFQKVMFFVLTPAARLMGYKSYYNEFDLRNNKRTKHP